MVNGSYKNISQIIKPNHKMILMKISHFKNAVILLLKPTKSDLDCYTHGYRNLYSLEESQMDSPI